MFVSYSVGERVWTLSVTNEVTFVILLLILV